MQLTENMKGFQTILTSYNTMLISNSIVRPDCYFILTGNKMISFADSHKRF